MNSNSTIEDRPNSGNSRRLAMLFLVIAAMAVAFWLSREYLSIEFLAEKEAVLKTFYADHPWIVIATAFLIYVAITGLSIPGATVLSLIYAWFFRFWPSLILISFASTAGATLAFLISRYLFRDFIDAKFGDRLTTFNTALEKEGALYLFTLRLVPAVPFFVINAVMGLTRLKVSTFWWVSQIGMLAGTAVYCYAGSRIPSLQSISEKGVGAVFSKEQWTQIIIAFVILGLFPLVTKKVISFFKAEKLDPAA